MRRNLSAGFHDGSIKQLVPVQPGWVLAVIGGQNEDGTTEVRLFPIMCWALIEQAGGSDLIEPVISYAEFGQAYEEDGIIIGPGENILARINEEAFSTSRTTYRIGTTGWQESYLREQGWIE